MAIVEFKNVSRIYTSGEHELKALDGVDMKLEKGKFVVILGPSGAGKSTLLNMLGGLDSPTSGKIYVKGKDISRLSKDELADYRAATVGFVFQFYNLVQNLTAQENVELAAQICRDPLPAEQVLAQVGLSKRMKHFPAQLSGGEQQRVAIARALAKNPKLLLCDEPTGALDYRTGKTILKLLQDTCKKSGKTVVVITHNQALTAMADRVIRVKSGKIISNIVNDAPVPVEQIEW